MIQRCKRQIQAILLGLSLLTLGTGCGTLTGAAVGGAAGAGIGAARDSNVGRSAAIGAGVGGALGAGYDIYAWRRDRNDDYDRDRDYYRD
jgi:hypothetical protein